MTLAHPISLCTAPADRITNPTRAPNVLAFKSTTAWGGPRRPRPSAARPGRAPRSPDRPSGSRVPQQHPLRLAARTPPSDRAGGVAAPT